MDFGIIGRVGKTGNERETHRGQLPSEPNVDLPDDVVRIERTELFVITAILLKGASSPLYLDDAVRVFWDTSHLDGVITEFEIERDPVKGHKMFIHVATPVFNNESERFDTTKYEIVKKIQPNY